MFKKASIYRVGRPEHLQGLEQLLEQGKFLSPGVDEMKSSGWSEVRDGALFMKSHGQLLLNFTIEKKVVPASAVKSVVAERCEELEKSRGFSLGKKERSEIKEQVSEELCSRALTTSTVTGVWIDTLSGRIVVDSSTVGTLELIVRALVVASDSLELTYLDAWAGAQMSSWLLEGGALPSEYTVDDAVQMEYPGERGTVVAFKKADLGTDAVHMHAAAGAIVTKMALTFRSRISFVLAPTQQLANLKLLDAAKDRQVVQDVDEQENNFMLMTLELRALIDSLSEGQV